MDKIYDVLILGAGMAGLTAGLYAVRYNLKTAILSKDFGGTGNIAGFVENWPGFVGSGLDLMNSILKQVKEAGVEFLQLEARSVEKENDLFKITTTDSIVHSKSLIVSFGMQHRKLNIKGEDEFLGKGVSYCATCDGAFFKNKTVAVIGGGDSAAKAALYLSELAKKVYIIHRRDELKCEPLSLELIKKKNNIEVHYNSVSSEILGDKKVNSFKIKKKVADKNEEIELKLDGIFIEIGATPFTEVVKNLKLNLDKLGFIITDKEAKTNVEGVFAAGDNTDTRFKQFVVSAGEGAIAAKSAYDYLRFVRK